MATGWYKGVVPTQQRWPANHIQSKSDYLTEGNLSSQMNFVFSKWKESFWQQVVFVLIWRTFPSLGFPSSQLTANNSPRKNSKIRVHCKDEAIICINSWVCYVWAKDTANLIRIPPRSNNSDRKIPHRTAAVIPTVWIVLRFSIISNCLKPIRRD